MSLLKVPMSDPTRYPYLDISKISNLLARDASIDLGSQLSYLCTHCSLDPAEAASNIKALHTIH
jgi:hypothetical protein